MINSRHNIGITPADLVSGIVELASPPEVYIRITDLLDNARYTVADVAGTIEKDPGMAARLLKLANSAFFGFPSEVSSVSRAVTLVGSRELRDLVLTTVVIEVFNGLPNELVSMSAFWDTSLRCAVLANALGIYQQQKEPEPIYVGALLHEVGHLVMYRKIPELCREALLQHRYADRALPDAERDVLGFDYAAVGAYLMRAWKVPSLVEQVVEYHLRPEAAPDFALEAAMVGLSRRIGQATTFDLGEIMAVIPPDDALWRHAGVVPAGLDQTLAVAEQKYLASCSLFH